MLNFEVIFSFKYLYIYTGKNTHSLCNNELAYMFVCMVYMYMRAQNHKYNDFYLLFGAFF